MAGKDRSRGTRRKTTGTPPPVAEHVAVQAAAEARQAGLPVVAVGASAGGLDAFKQFLTSLPPAPQMAFVLIQHLNPTHESLTAELLSRHSNMPVVQVADEMPVEPNHVYVIPPNKYLTISGRTLHLTEPVERRGVRGSIDAFFRSLADDLQERAIGVILTGSGRDGTLGVRQLKAGGGMVVVQSPDTAAFDSMPRSAIATEMVDDVVPIEKMADVLLGYVRHWDVNGAATSSPVEGKTPDHLSTVLALLRAQVKYDFSGYKKSTVARRVRRRMGLKHIEEMGAYVELLRQSGDELNALFKDLLIGVTRFFRDSDAWEVLDRLVITPLVDRVGHPRETPDGIRPANGSNPAAIRVWVPGCATGEEAYSIAMLLIERMQIAAQSCDFQIFASDIDQDALAFAQAGVYAENIGADVSAERLRQFMVKCKRTYRINRGIRNAVVFAEQNLISDPPFSKLDLISCRNLLMYLEPETQRRLMSLFHFAIRDGGYLFLGTSETTGQQQDWFEPLSQKCRIYQRVSGQQHERIILPAQAPPGPSARQAVECIEPRSRHLANLSQHLLVRRHAPPCVLIDRQAEILYLSGPLDRYLQLPSGVLGADLIAMAREGLRTRLRAAVQQAIRENRRVEVSGVRLNWGTRYGAVNLVVEPIRQPKKAETLLLVSFEEPETLASSRVPAADAAEPTRPDAAEREINFEAVIRQLHDELRHTREDLQGTIEELETSNEELKAANEEAMSINEELHLANEEMETSKEELQSLNEELLTVNSQLEEKLSELESTNNDLLNLLASTQIATIFLDRQFRLRRFTPATQTLLPVIEPDIGRPFRDLARYFTDDDLLRDAEQVLQHLRVAEKVVPAHDGRWYARRIAPYCTNDNRIDGVVITFSDVTERNQAEQALERLAAIMQSTLVTLVVLAPDGTILNWNRGAERVFGYTEQEAVGKNIAMLLPQDRSGEFVELVAQVRRGESVEDFDTVHLHKDGTPIDVDLTLSAIVGNGFCWIAREQRFRRRLEQQLAELADAEQQQLGRELHDSLGPQISALGVLISALRAAELGEQPVSGIIARLESSVGQAKQQLRGLVKWLLPVSVDAAGLRVALQELAQEISRAHRIPCRFECPHAVPLHDNFVATQLYLIAREAALNAARHARASQIVIGLIAREGIRMSVEDDGGGLVADADRSPGMGLHIMRYRCGLIGGTFRCRSADQGGTIVVCELPENAGRKAQAPES